MQKFAAVALFAQPSEPMFAYDRFVSSNMSKRAICAFETRAFDIKIAHGRPGFVHARKRNRKCPQLRHQSLLDREHDVGHGRHQFVHDVGLWFFVFRQPKNFVYICCAARMETLDDLTENGQIVFKYAGWNGMRKVSEKKVKIVEFQEKIARYFLVKLRNYDRK